MTILSFVNFVLLIAKLIIKPDFKTKLKYGQLAKIKSISKYPKKARILIFIFFLTLSQQPVKNLFQVSDSYHLLFFFLVLFFQLFYLSHFSLKTSIRLGSFFYQYIHDIHKLAFSHYFSQNQNVEPSIQFSSTSFVKIQRFFPWIIFLVFSYKDFESFSFIVKLKPQLFVQLYQLIYLLELVIQIESNYNNIVI